MAWPHLPGIVKVVVTFGFAGEPSVNVHFVRQREGWSPIPPATLATIAQVFTTALDDEWMPVVPDAWSVDEVVATDYSIPNGEQVAQVAGLPLAGVDISGTLPASIALVTSHRTNKTGRSFRGRSFLPGMSEDGVSHNNAQAPVILAAGDYFDALDVGLDAEEFDLVVYSLYTAGAERAVPVATFVTNRIINSRVDTQRRRLPG
jgi:hypothetical protein